jgi:hypothetical protein
MTKQEDVPLNEGSTQRTTKENKTRKSWAEEHGGLIFLIICISGISLAILYDSCMY